MLFLIVLSALIAATTAMPINDPVLKTPTAEQCQSALDFRAAVFASTFGRTITEADESAHSLLDLAGKDKLSFFNELSALCTREQLGSECYKLVAAMAEAGAKVDFNVAMLTAGTASTPASAGSALQGSHNPDDCTVSTGIKCGGGITACVATCVASLGAGCVACVAGALGGDLIGTCCPCLWKVGIDINC